MRWSLVHGLKNPVQNGSDAARSVRAVVFAQGTAPGFLSFDIEGLVAARAVRVVVLARGTAPRPVNPRLRDLVR